MYGTYQPGALKHDLAGHSHAFAVAFSSDGSMLASAGRWDGGPDHGNGVHIWNPATGEKMRTLLIDANGGTHAVVFSPTNKLLVIGSRNYDKENDTSSTTISVAYPLSGITEWQRTIPGWANPKSFSPDGKTIFMLSGGKSIPALDTATGADRQEITPLASPQRSVWNDLAVVPSGRFLAIGGADDEKKGSVELWDLGGLEGEDKPLRQPRQRPLAAEVRVAEPLDVVPEAVGQREQQPVVRHLAELERAAHLEVEAVADQHERDVVERVRVALAQLVGPDDQRVVEQAAVAARLGRLGQPLGQVGELLAVPVVDLASACPAASSLLSGSCDSSWWPSSMPEPAHPGLADRVGVLQRRDAGEVGGEAVDHQVDLHLADLRHVVVLFLDARLELAAPRGRRPASSVALQLLLHLADERRVLVEQLAVLGADRCADLLQVVLQVVEDAPQALLVLHPAVELGEHLVRVVDRRERLVRAGVDHARPGVGPVGHHDAELQRAEPRARRRVASAGSS